MPCNHLLWLKFLKSKDLLRIFLEVRFFRIYFSMLKIFGNTGISLCRAIQCTKYKLQTRTVDYGLWTRAQLSVLADCKKKELRKTTTQTEAENSSENHFSFIKKYYACKMRSNYAGMKISGWSPTNKQHVVKSRPSCNYKTGHFRSFIGRERP